jgi:hypothetical protein
VTGHATPPNQVSFSFDFFLFFPQNSNYSYCEGVVGVLGLGDPGLEAPDFAPNLLAGLRSGWNANFVLQIENIGEIAC